MDRLDDVITPELALVCPDLRARALAALPDRPWEAWAPPRQVIVAAEDTPNGAGLVVGERSDDSAAPEHVSGGHTRLRRLAVSLIVLTWIILLSLAFLPPTDRPTLEDGAGASHPDLQLGSPMPRASLADRGRAGVAPHHCPAGLDRPRSGAGVPACLHEPL